MARQKNTPNDPERRERIVSATMSLLQDEGIAGVTARAVAARAGVPVGSVSYHFASVRELLLEASRRVAALRVASLTAWSATATATGEAFLERLADLIHEQLTTGRGLTVVAYELYILGLRDEEFRVISDSISQALRATLAAHLAPGDAAHLAATADGLQLASLVQPRTPTKHDIQTALGRAG